MKSFNFLWRQGAQLSDKVLGDYQNKFAKTLDQLKKAQLTGYQTPFGSINMPKDEEYLRQITTLAEQKKKLNPAAIVLIGIGGSSLGTRALWQAAQAIQPKNEIDFFCVETVDPDFTALILAHIDSFLAQKKPVIIILVTKSGTTTETIANFLLFQELLIKYHPNNHHEFVIAITDQDSALWHYAQQEKYALLPIPAQVGGRYSVFSAVGLFPLAMLGIDIKEIVESAAHIIDPCLQEDITKNPAALTAAFLDFHYKQKIAIADYFLFSSYLFDTGNWCRQLMGESIGKKQLTTHEPIGLTPTVSLGSTDLHSVGQLYVGGPNARSTLFVTIDNYHYNLKISENASAKKLNNMIQGKSLATIMHAIAQGTIDTYEKNNLPFIQIQLPQVDCVSVAAFMQYQMIMMMYLGALLEVNPFDQPQVELYKKETKRILANE